MKLFTTIRSVAAASLVVGLGLTASGIAGAATSTPVEHAGHALFVETDAASGNSIISYSRAADGTISYAGTYATGGLGSIAPGAVADPLASQSGLTLIDNARLLVATNPGSDTVSVFAVHGTRLDLVQQLSSGGIFPNSVSSNGDLVAVLNAGGTGSVAEFRLVGERLVAIDGQVRALGLTQTGVPGFLYLAGQVGYTPDGAHLVVTTKHSTDSFDVFSVGVNGELGTTPVVTPADKPVPFAFNFDSAGNLVAVEAGGSFVSIYSVHANGTLSLIGASVSDGATALCWISTSHGYFFGDNAGSSTVSSFTETSSGAPVLVNATAGTAHAGTTDSTVSPDGNFLYVESGGSGAIDVFSISATGALTHLESVLNVPLASEGIAAS